MIYNVPIEKYEERYTEQWSRWFPAAYSVLGLDFVNVEGESITAKVESGSVLDCYGTNYYKASQLQKLILLIREGKINDGDTIFFHDLWFPGIEAIQYIRDITKKEFKIWGILHAGTWDRHDFTTLNGMRKWGKYVEKGWLEFFDKVFLGSEFHKQIILKRCNRKVAEKLVVSGIPFEYKEVQRKQKKENIVVFPHRLNKEKQPWLFDNLAEKLKKHFPDWQFIKTKEVCKNKEEYYQLLGRSKLAVSFAKQETFGYAMLEAVANGCIPIVPDKLSYATMPIYEGYRFKNLSAMIKYLKKELKEPRQTDLSDKLGVYETTNILKTIFK